MKNHKRTTALLFTVGLTVIALSSLTTVNASAQEPEVLFACYIPQTGVVYRVNPPDEPGKYPDLRDECSSERHVLFSWNEQGPAGPQGDPGPTGDPGDDGEPGQSCWDLDGNGVGDLPDEDANSDGVVDVLDCKGLTGPEGPPGEGFDLSCSTGEFPQWSGSEWYCGTLEGGVTDHGSLTGLEDDDHPQYALDAEVQAADQVLLANINAEAATRTADVDSEEFARITADVDLQAKILAEATIRTDDVDSEEAARITADVNLQANIDAEAVARIANVRDEENTRIAADAFLQDLIDEEASTRQETDSFLQQLIDDLQAQVAALEARVAALEAGGA